MAWELIATRMMLLSVAASALVEQQEAGKNLNMLASRAAGLEPITVTQASPTGLS
jgi:hypothetical protein